jgi:hypothetical protein
MMILIITMSDDQVSKHKWLLHATVMQAGQIEWIKERGETTHWLVTIITQPGGVSFIIINFLIFYIFCVFLVIQVTDTQK